MAEHATTMVRISCASEPDAQAVDELIENTQKQTASITYSDEEGFVVVVETATVKLAEQIVAEFGARGYTVKIDS